MSDYGRVIDAPVNQEGPVPAYRIIEYNKPWEKELCAFDERTSRIKREKVMIDKGYLIVFPRGHTLLVEATEEALEQHGFKGAIPMIRMGSESEISKDVPTGKTIPRVIERA